MNTTENNKKLAKFLGWKEQTDPTERWLGQWFDQKTGERYVYLHFNTSWDWLMKVAEKIEETETKNGTTFTIDIHKDNVIINQYGKYNHEIIVTEGGTRLENLYKACIEFVEWWKKK